MATTITRRISAIASGGTTRRVSASSLGSSYDTWGGSWGNAWAACWRDTSTVFAALGLTQRVTVTPTTNITRRVIDVA